jgi:regulator of sirC expression with transglutaminase-like and TPR domain
MIAPRDAFARVVARPDGEIDLAEAALWIAAEDHPDMVVDDELAKLDSLGARAAERIAGTDPLALRVTALNRFLFEEQGFRGNRDDYYDPRNSYLNEVLRRRVGIPISLSLVYLAVAGRAGVQAAGICFPGHFLLKCSATAPAPEPAARPRRTATGPRAWRGGEGEVVVDAFAGSMLSVAECQRRLDAAAGRPVPLYPALHLRAASHREILVRVLANLKQIFVGRGDFGAALSCSDRILLLAPDSPREHKEREALRARVRLH